MTGCFDLRYKQGFFDANVILSPKIQDFVTTSVLTAFPWSLNVDSIDFITLFYALLVVCHAILYHSTVDNLQKKNDLCGDTEVTANHINDLFCLSDWLFWLILFLQFFLLLEITAAVSIVYVSVLYSLNFVMLLYVACASAFSPIHTLKYASITVWAVYAFLTLIFTDASVLDGTCLIVMNIILCFFYYITVIETGMTINKFLNIRLWTVTVLNFFFIITYVNNILYMETQQQR